MEQAKDLLDESEALYAVLQDLPADRWQTVTQFKDWTLNDVLVHLHFWNQMVELSLRDEDAFQTRVAETFAGIKAQGFRPTENAVIAERGADLLAAWRNLYRHIGTSWAQLDPKKRVKWAGPDMSVRSSITARQMETWAHGQEVFDALGIERRETDRIRNIVILGVNTFGWTYKVNGLPVPEDMPRLELSSPSGELWKFGESQSDIITGSAVDFARVVTQTRNYADTDLQIAGTVASEWMSIAQCFAGAPEKPPAKGQRHRVQR